MMMMMIWMTYVDEVDCAADDVAFQRQQQVFITDRENHLDVLLQTSRYPLQPPLPRPTLLNHRRGNLLT